MLTFKAKIFIIGINPYVLLPSAVLKGVLKQSAKEKGPIQVRGTLEGHPYKQTLVRYAGKWRLYLNGPMRKAAKKDVGDSAAFTIEFDPVKRTVPLHPKLRKAFKENPIAKKTFDQLSHSRQKEILRYIVNLKTEEAVNKNVQRAIRFLIGKQSFIGMSNPR